VKQLDVAHLPPGLTQLQVVVRAVLDSSREQAQEAQQEEQRGQQHGGRNGQPRQRGRRTRKLEPQPPAAQGGQGGHEGHSYPQLKYLDLNYNYNADESSSSVGEQISVLHTLEPLLSQLTHLGFYGSLGSEDFTGGGSTPAEGAE
jgi:hypothetical protein